MTRVLDRAREQEVADEVSAMVEMTGWTVEEIIPGLVLAIRQLAADEQQALDEAMDLLAD